MANKDMNIAMKFTADVNNARKNIKELDDAIKNSSAIAQDANKKNAGSYNDIIKRQTDAMNRGQQYESELQKQAKSQEAAAKAAEAHQKEVEKLRNGLDKLLASIDPATKGLGRLDELESKLRQSKKAGILDNETFDDYLGKINNQRAALSTVDSLSKSTKKLTFNTKTSRRELKSFIQQLASGNFTNAGSALINLGNTTGRLPPLFSAATLSVGAFIAAAYGIIKVFSSIKAEQERFNRALASTGNYAGTTASGLEAMSNRIGKINSNYSDTSKVIADLAGKGNLTAKSIENIGTASAYMSVLTGKSADESAKSFDGITDSVTKWAMETNKQYNWLDVATYNRIHALEEQGKTEEAIAVATGKYSEVMEQRVNDMNEQLKGLSKGWAEFKKGVSDFGQYLKRDFKIALNMASLDEQIAKMQEDKKLNSKITFDGVAVQWTKKDDEELEQLIKERELIEANNEAKSKAAQLNKAATQAQQELDKIWEKSLSDTEKQKKSIDDLRKKYEALWVTVDGRKSLQDKGVTSEDGKTFSGGQYDKDVKEITDKGIKQYNEDLTKSVQLEKELTTLAKVMFDITEGQYKNASQAEKDRAIALAKQIDAQKAENKKKKKRSRIKPFLMTKST
ncbi:phage tail length tape measure family protein [Orbaceae bacterium ESL0727]|nr:phage tail length tape measure family protein [Orbaceae bacterium ESL0727]